MELSTYLQRWGRRALWFCVWAVTIPASIFGVSVAYSHLTAQRIAPGEIPQGPFYVVFLPGADGAEFDTGDLRRLPEHITTFLLPKDHDEYRWQGARPGFEKYRVLERTADSQVIELHRHTSDYDFLSRYRATKLAVVPIYSRIMGPGTSFIAVPIGVALGFLIVRLLQWAWNTALARRTDHRTSHAAE